MDHPRFCERITRLARKGTYLSRKGSTHYSIKWDDEIDPRWVPAVGIKATGIIDERMLNGFVEAVSKNISSKTHLRRRGGLKKGKKVNKVGDVRTQHVPVKDESPKKV